jgi:hypothetical protein
VDVKQLRLQAQVALRLAGSSAEPEDRRAYREMANAWLALACAAAEVEERKMRSFMIDGKWALQGQEEASGAQGR